MPRITCGRSRRLRELVGTGELQYNPEEGLWSEALHWYGPAGFQAPGDEPLPVALLESDCALRDLAVSDLKCSGLETDPVLTSSDMANLHSAVESGLALALLPESSVTSSRVRPVQLNELPGQRLLSMNVVTANTLGPGAQRGVVQRPDADSDIDPAFE